jgi:hypothetical protein
MKTESKQNVESSPKYLLERINLSYLLDFSTPKNQGDVRGMYHSIQMSDFGKNFNPLKFTYVDVISGVRYIMDPIFLNYSFDHVMNQFENPRHRIVVLGKSKNRHIKSRKGIITLESLTFKKEISEERKVIYPFEWYGIKPKNITN